MDKKKGLLSLIDRMAKVIYSGNPPADLDLENEFRMMVMEQPAVDEELAALLPTLIPRTAKEEARINVAISLLACLLQEIRTDMERGRKGAIERMEALQTSPITQIHQLDPVHLLAEALLIELLGRVGRRDRHILRHGREGQEHEGEERKGEGHLSLEYYFLQKRTSNMASCPSVS